MKSARKFGVAAASAAITLVMASTALAEEEQAQAGMALPGQGAAAGQGNSDHDAMVGRLAVGYLGRYQVPIATGLRYQPPGNPIPVAPGIVAATDAEQLQAPVIGVRYWLDSMVGIDAGLGLFNGGGGTDEAKSGPTTSTSDVASRTAFLIHGGIPLSLAADRHYSFQIVPELNVGFSTATQKGTGSNGADVDLSGFTLDVGARAGAEIHFGFIGVPQLSLQGSVGLLFQTQSWKAKDNGPAGTQTSSSRTNITTTLGDNPWNIFTSNVAALYYF